MSKDYKSEWGTVVEEAKGLNGALGDVMKAYSGLHKAVMVDGALDKKTKELIALGIGIGRMCEGCIISHVRGALKAGATKAQISDAVAVAVMMSGGPGTTYGAKAVAAAEQFAES
jgi:AhpD family alkylhydroperoxidase